MGVMQTITGEIEAGEARQASSAIASRQRGSILIYYLLQLAILISGGISGYALGWVVNTFLTQSQTLDPVLLAFAGVGIGGIVYMIWCRGFVVRNFKKRMADRGMDTRFQQTLFLNEDTIEMESGSVRAIAPWASRY